ncbi:MAG: tetratricopeptide repeat protein [Candidatus Latescibacterota bacterium]
MEQTKAVRTPWLRGTGGLALGSTLVFVACLLLGGVEVLGFLRAAVRPLLGVVAVAWAVHFALRTRIPARRRRGLIWAPGPAGGILEIADLGGLHLWGEAAAGTVAEGYFIEGGELMRAGRFAEAAAQYQRSTQEHPSLPALLNLGVALVNTAELAAAAEALGVGRQRSRSGGLRALEAAFALGLGAVRARQGRLDEALHRYEEARLLFVATGDERGQASALLDSAMVLANEGKAGEARRRARQAARAFRGLRGALGSASAASLLAAIAVEEGEVEEGLRLQQAALVQQEVCGNLFGQAMARTHLGNAYFRAGRSAAALVEYRRAAEVSRRAGDPLGEATSLVNEGNVGFRQGDLEAALRAYEEALGAYGRCGSALGQADALTNIGSVRVRQGQLAEALAVLERARELYTESGVRGRGALAAERLVVRLERKRQRALRKRGEGGPGSGLDGGR